MNLRSRFRIKLLHHIITHEVEIEPVSSLEQREMILSEWDKYYPERRQKALLRIAEVAAQEFEEIGRAKAHVELLTGTSIKIKTPTKKIILTDAVIEQMEQTA